MPSNLVPVRFPAGVATQPREQMFGRYLKPNPIAAQYYEEDFNTYNASDWTVTATTGTTALTAGAGGKIIQSTAAASNDIQANQQVVTSWQVQSGGQLWFCINVALSDATASAFLAGLANSFATMAPTDGIYFSKAAASTTLNLILNKSSTATMIAVGTMANATAYSLGFYYDGKPSPTLYVFSSIGVTAAVPFGQQVYQGGQVVAAAGANSANALTNLPTAALTLGFGVKAGAVAVKTSTIDYVIAGCEIPTRF